MADVTKNPDDDITTYWFPVDPSQNDSSDNTYLDTIVDMQVGFFKSGAYSADWSTVDLPASPSFGKWCVRVNTDASNQMRVYYYNGLTSSWESIAGGAGPALTAGDNLTLDGTTLNVTIDTIGTPTYVSLQDMIDTLQSAGAITGGIISDGGSETINVAAGTGFIRDDDDPTAPLLSFDWIAETGLSIPTNSSRHVGIEYNAGSPQVVITADHADFNEHDNWHLGDVVNEGGTLHIQNIPHNVNNAISHIIERFTQTEDPKRGFGLILGESADVNRYVTVSQGSIWNRLTESAIAGFDSSGADRFDIYHRDGGAGFTKVANQQSWDMDSYDDGNIQTLGSNKYAVMWFYMEYDGQLTAQYGRAQYVTQFQAEEEEVPSTAPDRITEHAILIGRLIFKKNTTPALAVETVFTTMFNTNGVTSHTELADVATDSHHTKYTDTEAEAAVEISHSEQVKAGMKIDGGGSITVDGSFRFGWSQRFIVISNGRGSHFSTSGYFDITQPTSGAITTAGGASEVSWNSSGIVIEIWSALYYILPIGSINGSLTANFRMVRYISDLEIPDDWIFIAGRNGDNQVVRVCNGILLLANETWVNGTSSMINTDIAWNASTVSQAEAETGTETIDRKWTAERVKQAIESLGVTVPNHNSLGGLNDGTSYEHITQTQKDALHNVITTLTHTSLTGKNSETNIQHLTDAQITALHDVYTDAQVDAIVLTHKNNASAHHIKTTNTDVSWNASTVSEAEAQAGTSTTTRKWTALRVKQAIEALGVTIPNHNSLGGLNDGTTYEHITQTQKTALHTIVSTLAALDTTMTGAILDDLNLFGSTNAAYVPCILEGDSSNPTNPEPFGAVIKNRSSGGMNMSLVLPLPPILGTYSLKITDVRVVLNDADSNDYVTSVRVYTAKNTTQTQKYNETDNLWPAGIYTSGSGVMASLTNFTMVASERVAVQIGSTNNLAGDLKIAGVFLRCYYGQT